MLGLLAVSNGATVAKLARVFPSAGDDHQLRLPTIETLDDMARPLLVELVAGFMDGHHLVDVGKPVVPALSKEGSDPSLAPMPNATREPDFARHLVALLTDQPADRFLPIFRRRE